MRPLFRYYTVRWQTRLYGFEFYPAQNGRPGSFILMWGTLRVYLSR